MSKASIVLAETAIQRLQDAAAARDKEHAHAAADDALCKLLVGLGYEDVVEEYMKVGKWYA